MQVRQQQLLACFGYYWGGSCRLLQDVLMPAA
jgi:hypothetical protein